MFEKMSNEEIRQIKEAIAKMQKSFEDFKHAVSDQLVHQQAVADRFDSQEAAFKRHTINSEFLREMLEDNKTRWIERDKQMQEYFDRMEPVINAFQGLDWSKKALMWIVVFVGAIFGVIVALKELVMKK